MEIKKPEPEYEKYPAKGRPIVRQIFAEEMRKHQGKTRHQCLEYLRANNLMGILPDSLKGE